MAQFLFRVPCLVKNTSLLSLVTENMRRNLWMMRPKASLQMIYRTITAMDLDVHSPALDQQISLTPIKWSSIFLSKTHNFHFFNCTNFSTTLFCFFLCYFKMPPCIYYLIVSFTDTDWSQFVGQLVKCFVLFFLLILFFL